MSGGTSVFTVISPHLDSFQVSTAGSGGPSLNARVTAAGLLADLPLQRQWRFASLRDGLRPPLTPEPLQADWAQAIRGQGTPAPWRRPAISEAVMTFHRMPISDEQYIAEARRRCAQEGEIEIDDDAQVSVSEDEGAYVQAWVWVTDAEVELHAEQDRQEA